MTDGDEPMPEPCASLLDAALLTDYWLADLREEDEAAIEEHLFACDDCGHRLRHIIALVDAVRELARSGSLRLVVSNHFLERASAEGLRVREYAPPPGGGVHCTVSAEDDLLIARLAVNLTGAGRVDLYFLDESGEPLYHQPDIPVNPASGEVIYQESMIFAKAAPDNTAILHLVAVDDAGAQRRLGEYTFHHQRTLPGPGALPLR